MSINIVMNIKPIAADFFELIFLLDIRKQSYEKLTKKVFPIGKTLAI